MDIYVCNDWAMSPNPKEWSPWDEFILVLAKNEKEAKCMSDCEYAVKVDKTKPCILAIVNEPAWGEDL